MANFNQFTGIGTLTRDVEIRQAGQTSVGNVSLAINEKYTTKSGEKREDVLFLECVLWGKTAELAGQYLAKGKQVLFSGRLKQENWEDKATGQKRSKVVLNVDDMQFLGARQVVRRHQQHDRKHHKPSRGSKQHQQSSSRSMTHQQRQAMTCRSNLEENRVAKASGIKLD
jgi:single stranded DNA-binding protein